MAFRDDREALRAHKEVLERELAATREKLETSERKDERDEAELEQLRREVTRLRRLAGDAEARPQPNRVALTAALGAACVIAMGAGMFVTLSHDTTPSQVAVQAAPAPASPPHALPPPIPSLAVRLAATVLSSVGRPDVPAGSGCVVEANVRGTEVDGLRVRCLEALVYDSRAELGVAATSFSAQASMRSTAVGEVYLVQYSETGQRTGPRAQITLDARRGHLRVWSEGAAPFDLRMAVDDRGIPNTVDASVRTQAPEARWRLAATLASHAGALPFTARECELVVLPETLGGAGHSCRVQLRCGEVLVYGAETSGYNRCDTVIRGERAFPSVHDSNSSLEDTDPVFELDVAGERLRVADSLGGSVWEATFVIGESPRCTLTGAWVGTLGYAALRLDGQRESLQLGGALTNAARAELRCMQGEGAITLDAAANEPGTLGTIHGRFGPDFTTFLGVTRHGRPLTLMRVLP
ncbi:MAG: hypothetical protein IPL19_26035 [Sandaracinaceae bacterium]|nr:hypothetical protein [Sandaracinaceae bacterium]MBK7151758.1 hypothetical protein [Sandaracinaceae bacterium]MBK7773276.1 hypothetical protein [Sandaracinaceae bacterium]MBK8411414.1 hypothetical protein [Sandaracinaceae bacterium]MBK8591791.1 hypothetical protein [Sandaracinaceae bacterium]